MLKKKIYSISFILFIFLTLSLVYCISIQNSLASKVLRLHILANSNSTFDQELKLKVRDEIINYISPLLKNSNNLAETKNIISNNITSINEIAQKTVAKYSNYTTKSTLTASSFPTKQYGNISFPAGNYEALKITIGEGNGNNWWCVMFPPLCFTNSSAGTFDEESKETLQASLSDEEYYMINNYDKPNVKIKFKLLEWLNS